MGALRADARPGVPAGALHPGIRAHRVQGGAEEEEEALEVFESAPPEASATTAVRNAAIALYAARGRADRAFALYEEMRAEGANAESFLESNAPDTITYNTLIAACVASNKSARASALLKDMIAAGVPRSERTYVSLMASASRTAPEGEEPLRLRGCLPRRRRMTRRDRRTSSSTPRSSTRRARGDPTPRSRRTVR